MYAVEQWPLLFIFDGRKDSMSKQSTDGRKTYQTGWNRKLCLDTKVQPMKNIRVKIKIIFDYQHITSVFCEKTLFFRQ